MIDWYTLGEPITFYQHDDGRVECTTSPLPLWTVWSDELLAGLDTRAVSWDGRHLTILCLPDQPTYRPYAKLPDAVVMRLCPWPGE